MPRTVKYRQCKLVKKIPEGEKHQTSWIPSEFAVEGKILKLRDSDGAWDNGWKVAKAGSHEVDHEEVNEMSQLHKRQRRASDI